MNVTRTLKQRLIDLAVLILVVGVLVAVVVVSGIFPIKASSGHWAITDATLQFASKRSIQTHSLGIRVPPLDEPEMIRLGAATYASNCAWCHGSPLELHPIVPSAMTPHPPSLMDSSAKWKDRELFYIAKHGIMFTGMPAWPTQVRDDEIWPVVSFLQAMGTMDAHQYSQLLHSTTTSTFGEVGDSSQRSWLKSCLDCHGRDGQSVAGPRVPQLQQLSSEYITATLHAIGEGERPSGIMQPIVSRLNADQISDIAKFFGADQTEQPKDPAGESIQVGQAAKVEDETIATGNALAAGANNTAEAGMKLIQHGSADRKIPACIECHGRSHNVASYPSLIGQSSVYIQTQLDLYSNGTRKGGEAELMHAIADQLDEAERIQVADAFSRYREDVAEPQD